MTLIVVPLAAGLLNLGWRSAKSLERTNVDLRMAALDTAVANWLTGGLRTTIAVGQTLSAGPSFVRSAAVGTDDDRRRQLIAVLGRYPAMASAYVGYADGKYIYAGRLASIAPARRAELDAPDTADVLLRTIEADGGARRESWSFQTVDGGQIKGGERPAEFDPRTRPWYREALAAKAATVTEPYEFALSGVLGLSVATPTADGSGVIGFDFTLEALSRVVTDYKISPNSIVVLATGAGNIIAESNPCPTSDSDCLPEDSMVRELVRRETTAPAGSTKQYVEHEVEVGGRTHVLMARAMAPVMGEHFTVVAAVPISELSARSHALILQSAIAGVAAVALAILAALLVSLMLSRSIARIAAKTERIRDLDFSDRTPVVSRIREILRLSSAVERMREGLEVFGRYVSKDLVRQIMEAPESAGVGGVRRDLTVLFTDIEGFSRLSEGMAPELLTSRLSRYFEALGTPIVANKGTIDKYIGDSIMAFWNAPVLDPDHVAHACRAALAAAAAGRQLADKWRALGRPGFRTRFGLHTGPAVVGNVGARDRINYTLVGAVANQASRLEGLNKVYGTEIRASGEVARLTTDEFVWREIDRVIPAGTTDPLDIFEPLGPANTGQFADFLNRWQQALAAYRDQRFAEAILHFECVAELRPGDGPCRVFIARCREFADCGVPDGWDATWLFDKK